MFVESHHIYEHHPELQRPGGCIVKPRSKEYHEVQKLHKLLIISLKAQHPDQSESKYHDEQVKRTQAHLAPVCNNVIQITFQLIG